MADTDKKLPPLITVGTVDNGLTYGGAPGSLLEVAPNALFEMAESSSRGDGRTFFGIFLTSARNAPCFLVSPDGSTTQSNREHLHTASWRFVRYLDIHESLTIFGSLHTDRVLDENHAGPMPDILKFGPKDRLAIDQIPDGVPYFIETLVQSSMGKHNGVCVNIAATDRDSRVIHIGIVGDPSSRAFQRMDSRTPALWKFVRFAELAEVSDNLVPFVTDFGLRHASTAAPDGAMPVGEQPPVLVPESSPKSIKDLPRGVPFLAIHSGGASKHKHERYVIITEHDGQPFVYFYEVNTGNTGERALKTLALDWWTFVRFLDNSEAAKCSVIYTRTASIGTNPPSAVAAHVAVPTVLPLIPRQHPSNNRQIQEIPDGVPYIVSHEGRHHQAVNITSAGHRRIKILKDYSESRKGKYLGHQRLSTRTERNWLFAGYLSDERLDPLIRDLCQSTAIPGVTAPAPVRGAGAGALLTPPNPSDVYDLESIPDGFPFYVLWGHDRSMTQVVKVDGNLHNQDVRHLDREWCSLQRLASRTRHNWQFHAYIHPGERIADALKQYVKN